MALPGVENCFAGVEDCFAGASVTEIRTPLNSCPLMSFAALCASLPFDSVTIAIQRNVGYQ